MKKTLYDILEVSEKASKEVIEKAYKVLAKKYHPDLQSGDEKNKAESKMKEINEAYGVLSDAEARKKYDEELAKDREIEKQEEYNKFAEEQQNIADVKDSTDVKQAYINDKELKKNLEENLKKQQEMYIKRQQELEKQYNNAYYKYLKSLGYKVKFKWTWKQYLILFIAIGILIIIGLILWIIPPTHDWMLQLYNENIIVKVIVNVFIGLFNGIGKIFDGIFNGQN